MENNLELTILMPCYNEEKSITFCVDEAMQALADNNICGEVLIADNGSTDKSVTIAKSLGARVVHIEEKGYGNALIGGIKAAHGKYVLMGDCDGSYIFADAPRFLEKLRENYSLVMGNRFKGGIEKGAMPFSHKYLGVPVLSLLGRLRYKVKIGDFHCGLRAFDREKALSLELKCSGMEFATEIIAKFAKAKEPICEIPTKLRPDHRNGPTHLRSIPDGLRHLKFIFFGK
ncbi:MAG: glycosyltransferase family 2 protein [Clostridia bacterium]|nr:glycosyltransferase family 2 protein [Clostridia bacterium]